MVLKEPRASSWSMVTMVPSLLMSGSFSSSYQSSTGPTGTPFSPSIVVRVSLSYCMANCSTRA